jgi:hypothetical protein
MRKWFGLVAVLLFPGSAFAASASAQLFAAVLQDPGHRQLVLQAAERTPAWTHLGCANASFAQAQEIGVYVPVTFDKNGAPVSGEWREGLIATGCGAPVTLNVLTRITAPATLSTGFLLPGDTIADPILQNAAQNFAAKAAGGLPPGCTDGFIANTRFAGYEGPDAAKQSGSWKEIWTLNLCGQPKQVVMHFGVDAASVNINAVPQ